MVEGEKKKKKSAFASCIDVCDCGLCVCVCRHKQSDNHVRTQFIIYSLIFWHYQLLLLLLLLFFFFVGRRRRINLVRELLKQKAPHVPHYVTCCLHHHHHHSSDSHTAQVCVCVCVCVSFPHTHTHTHWHWGASVPNANATDIFSLCDDFINILEGGRGDFTSPCFQTGSDECTFWQSHVAQSNNRHTRRGGWL